MVSRTLSVSNSLHFVPAQEIVVKHPHCRSCNEPWIVSHTHQHRDGTWGVPSSKPGSFAYYWVRASTEDRDGYSCTCPRFRFHRHEASQSGFVEPACKHIALVLSLIADYRWNDLPAAVWCEWQRAYDDFPQTLYD